MCLEYKIYNCRHLSSRCTSQSSNQCTDWMCFLRWSMIFLRHMVYTQHHRLNRLHCSIFQQGTSRIDRQKQDQHSPKNDLQKKVNRHPFHVYGSLLAKKGKQVILGLHPGLGGAMVVGLLTCGHSKHIGSGIGSDFSSSDFLWEMRPTSRRARTSA
jgi:hypothetical protein